MTGERVATGVRPGAPARQRLAIALAAAATVPGLVVRLGDLHLPSVAAAALFGLAVVGAAFLLAWAAEVIQLDVSQGLALALLALIAVLPEYAVDFVFTWKAGQDPAHYAPLALANMTGGNRLLIGIGWPLVVFITAYRVGRRRKGERGIETAADAGPPPDTPAGTASPLDTDVHLPRAHAVEVAFLGLATLYSLTLPLKHTITLVDSVILIGIFVWYLARVTKIPSEEPELVGPSQLVGALPTTRRRAAVAVMIAGSAVVILLCAEPFADALVHTGQQFGVSTFLLVQWLAPLASETPELLIAAMFAWRLSSGLGLGALVSSKVNQWTLLVGSLPLVFALSAGALHGLPVDAVQREELLLTAAQSAFAVAVLASRSLNVREAAALLGLFLAQFVLGAVLPSHVRELERIVISVVYLALAAGILWRQRREAAALCRDGLIRPVAALAEGDPEAAAPARS